jgi:peptidyl-tRNA hydrolase, PTH1 family
VWLVVGLGNPGSQYQGNRHNVGFLVVDELLRRGRAPAPRAKFGAEINEASVAGDKVLFCKPMEFMNLSGQAVARAAQFWKVAPAQTVVVHDELDVPFGRLKLGIGGGPGGHNGVRSIIADWGTPEFNRVRVGISRPTHGRDAAAYVLENFTRDEQAQLPLLVGEAADAVETIVSSGLSTAMNRFNAKKKEPKVE